ncbi:LacI family DNA-binding transcriptional regulator [Streptomyces prasinosporus]|uniref:LacI family DNA-binding transcriptional regulator n=1 Tax=Streptomyces prasinosporus TaxID=68256 RepID=A0ABP6UJ82_9ACTN
MARASTRPTSRDVAQAAGVSQAAVSLVLGDKWRGRVSEATAQRVREAARTLGYRPNLAARNLRLGRTRTVLLVVPALTTEFFAGVYTGAARVASRHGFGVVLYPSPEGIGPARDPFASAQAALDGVIASSMAAEALTAIRGDQLPLVMLDSDPEGTTGAATVNLDIADGVRQVAGHLLALGHRRFLHLAADVASWTFEVRARELAARLRGAPGTSLRTTRSPISIKGAEAAAHAALSDPDRPTAVVCDDDQLAAGAYKAARRLGLRVPDDLSVTGHGRPGPGDGDRPGTDDRPPGRGTLRANAGMQALLAVLNGEQPSGTGIPVHLEVRGSTTRVP